MRIKSGRLKKIDIVLLQEGSPESFDVSYGTDSEKSDSQEKQIPKA